MIFSSAALNERKKRTANVLNTVLKENDLVLVFSGNPIQKPGGHDQHYPFLPHPDYFWLTGTRRPYGISAYSKSEGWIDFVLPITREEMIWEGGGEAMPGRPLKDFDVFISARRAERIFLLGQAQTHYSLSSVNEDERAIIQEIYSEVRRAKDAEEVRLVEQLGAMAAKGYKRIKSCIRPGLTERELQIEYETEVFRAGAEKMPYDSIVGTGTNSAVLHAIPTSRIIKDGEHVLIDAGADLHDYCVDITRIFPVNGSMSERQRTIYDLVKSGQEKSISLCRPGVEWKDVHLASAQVMAEGLRALGILKVSAEEAIETGAIAVFFPHGVGHMVGLRVRDVGGPPNPDPKKYAGAKLRVDMTLKNNYLMTVEPGLYFIDALLNDTETRNNFKDQINWNEAEKWKDFGGVRIEDDILITESGPKNLTSMVEK